MIKLPDVNRAFEYENSFYLSSDITRISKILAQYELYKMAQGIPGAIVECGIFKGASFIRFATFRDLFGNPFSKKLKMVLFMSIFYVPRLSRNIS